MSENSERFFKSTFSSNIISGGIITIQLFMCSYCLHLYLQAPSHIRRSRRIYIAVSWTIFILDLIYRTGLMWAQHDDLVFDMAGFSRRPYWVSYLGLAAGNLIVLLGDALLVYRCLIVWTGRRLIVAVPAMLWVAFAALSLAVSVHPTDVQIMVSCCILSAAVNVAVTILIAYKMWKMRRQQAKLLDKWDTQVYLRVASLVAESAIPCALCSLAYAACGLLPKSSTPSFICMDVVAPLWDTASVLSPQWIIWRVSLQRSFTHVREISHAMSALKFERHSETEISHHSDPDDILLVDRQTTVRSD